VSLAAPTSMGCGAESRSPGPDGDVDGDADWGGADGDADSNGDADPGPWARRFVGADNLVVEEGDAFRCQPGHPEDDLWYGCLVYGDHCFGPSARLRERADGGTILQMTPKCASRGIWDTWDARVDDVPVAPNALVWTADVSVPPGALVPGTSIQLDQVAGSSATLRWNEEIRLEEAVCGHPPVENFNGEGDRRAICRVDWRSFTFAAGEDPGLAPSAVTVEAFDPSPGGRVALTVHFSGCAEGLQSIDEPGTNDTHTVRMEPRLCCAPFASNLSWTVQEGGVLVPEGLEQAPEIQERCCGPTGEDDCWH